MLVCHLCYKYVHTLSKLKPLREKKTKKQKKKNKLQLILAKLREKSKRGNIFAILYVF